MKLRRCEVLVFGNTYSSVIPWECNIGKEEWRENSLNSFELSV